MAYAQPKLTPREGSLYGEAKLNYELHGSIVRRTLTHGPNAWISDVRVAAPITLGSADLFEKSWLASKNWPQVHKPKATLTVADLFCGSGGLTLGAWEAARSMQIEIQPVLAIDNDRDALDVYRANFAPAASYCAPIEQIINGHVGSSVTAEERLLQRVVSKVDLLVAGPPCQGHSDLNNHTRRDDPRNALISSVVRFAELFAPTHLIIENVQGVRHDRSGAFQTARAQLEALGYETADFLVDAAEIGLPQNRRRCFMIASRTVLADHARIMRLNGGPARTFDWACQDLETSQEDGVFDTAARVFPENLRRMKYLLEHDLYDLPNEERPDCHRLKDHAYTSVYGRLRPNVPSPTITTGFGSPGQGRYMHPRFARTITPHEAARLQFIPDFFRFPLNKRKRLQKLIGNAVPARLAYAVVLDLLIHG